MQTEVSKLNVKFKRILHIISISGTYMMLFGFLYLLQQFTIGMIPWFRYLTTLDGFELEPFIFVITSVLIIKKFVKISSPYRE